MQQFIIEYPAEHPFFNKNRWRLVARPGFEKTDRFYLWLWLYAFMERYSSLLDPAPGQSISEALGRQPDDIFKECDKSREMLGQFLEQHPEPWAER